MPYDFSIPVHDKDPDISPWINAPSSSRVSRYRYDHANGTIEVQWTNHKNHGYIYADADYETYRSFARAVSKGKRVNTHLNHLPYRLMDVTEVGVAPNPSRQGLTSRVRG